MNLVTTKSCNEAVPTQHVSAAWTSLLGTISGSSTRAEFGDIQYILQSAKC